MKHYLKLSKFYTAYVFIDEVTLKKVDFSNIAGCSIEISHFDDKEDARERLSHHLQCGYMPIEREEYLTEYVKCLATLTEATKTQ